MTIAEWADTRRDENLGSENAFVRFITFYKANEHREEDQPPGKWDAEFAAWEPPA